MGRKKLTAAERIRRLSADGHKPSEIAKQLNVSVQRVYQVRSNQKAQERSKEVKQAWVPPALLPVPDLPITMEEMPSDPVNHPAHYKAGGIETIDFIEAKQLNYNLGNVIKYITRSDLKGNRKQDLEKALWYLKREVEKPLQAT